MWGAVLLGCLACFILKGIGYLAPEHWLSNPRVSNVASLLTAGLLGALVVVQTFANGTHLAIDARLPAVIAAGIALWLRQSFIVVVLVGLVCRCRRPGDGLGLTLAPRMGQ